MSIKDVELVQGQSACALLTDHTFLTRWQELFDKCSYATVFQTPWFVGAWYETYRAQWQPVIVRSLSGSGDLVGLWFLAHDSTAETLVHAGADQAEYQTWLALPGDDTSFLSAAWRALGFRLRFSKLQFKYLPTVELGDALVKATAMQGRVVLRRRRRPLINLDPADLRTSFAKKSNKSRFNRLKRLGELEFHRLTDIAELERVVDDLITYYDFRHGAVHRSMLFQGDPQRRAFHMVMFASGAADIYVTVTYLNGSPIAAFWGAASGKTVHLGMIVHSPFLAEHSPGKLHIMQLSGLLLREGRDVLDLTPGEDAWKERFANAHDEVAEAIVYRSISARAATQVLHGIWEWGKRCAAAVGVTPADARLSISRLRRAGPASAFRKLRELTWVKREFRVYRAGGTLAKAYHYDERVHGNSLSDLLAFEPGDPWQTKAGFLSSALERLERGELAYTIKKNDRLIHSGWMVPAQPECYMTEVGQSMTLPPGSVMFCDFYTDPKFRGRGLYRATIGHMLCSAFADEATRYAYIAVLADNLPSRRVIESAGFEYRQSFFFQLRFGIEKKWAGPLVEAVK